jgi:hypothetical protein
VNHWTSLTDPASLIPKVPCGVSRVHSTEDAPESPEPEPEPVRTWPMTYPEAIYIRERARNRQPVKAAELLEAETVIRETRAKALAEAQEKAARLLDETEAAADSAETQTR